MMNENEMCVSLKIQSKVSRENNVVTGNEFEDMGDRVVHSAFAQFPENLNRFSREELISFIDKEANTVATDIVRTFMPDIVEYVKSKMIYLLDKEVEDNATGK